MVVSRPPARSLLATDYKLALATNRTRWKRGSLPILFLETRDQYVKRGARTLRSGNVVPVSCQSKEGSCSNSSLCRRGVYALAEIPLGRPEALNT